MDGLALARRLKKDSDTQHITIIAIIAAPEQFRKEQALAAGCDAYILKPVAMRKLSKEIAA